MFMEELRQTEVSKKNNGFQRKAVFKGKQVAFSGICSSSLYCWGHWLFTGSFLINMGRGKEKGR